MRRFLSLMLLLFVAVPFGASVAGCGTKAAPVQYCNGLASGPTTGQVASISLAPTLAIYGESLNYGQVGAALSATAVDCKGAAVPVKSFIFATTDMSFADINPSNGQVCGGMWNRNSGGGIPDYTTCNGDLSTAPANIGSKYLAYVTATAQGAVSNAIPVYIHPIVTGVVIGNPSPAGCSATSTDPSTNCCPAYTQGTIVAPAYTGSSCLSQGTTAQLTARVYQNGTTNPADNITCQAGHVNYAAQTATIFTVDENGVATALQPGATQVTARIANSGTGGNSAGYFATCPPASIVLTIPGAPPGASAVTVGVNNSQPLNATILDTNGVTLTGVSLEFDSTAPTTTPVGGGLVTPIVAGAATITAVCDPAACNSSPFSQIGLYGNGKPVTSNGIQVTSPGTTSTKLYAASTESQYFFPIDFSTGQSGTLVKLPYVPNSMVISQSGTSIFLGSSTALMVVSTTGNSVVGTYTTSPGTVLSVAPGGSVVVVTDPVRQTVSLVSSTGTLLTVYGGVGTQAAWSPDSQTVYIAAGNQLLVHSSFTGWTAVPLSNTTYNDVAVTVPAVGAFFAGPLTEARSYCASTVQGGGNPPVETNTFYPVANDTIVANDRIAATNDGRHILGAVAAGDTFNDIAVTLPTQVVNGVATPAACPMPPAIVTPTYFTTSVTSQPLAGIVPSLITGVIPTSSSTAAFVTYNGTGGNVPLYIPSATGAGVLSNVPLANGATAPVAGVFATDNLTFFTGTSGDNQIHLLTTTNGLLWQDSSQIAPMLPNISGTGTATPNLLVQQPKRPTS